jgi:hypothetical protein
MVFVAMTSDDLLRRTAGYTIDYVATRSGSSLSPSAPSRQREQLTLLESLHDPAISEAARRRNGEPIPPHALRIATRERRFPTNVDEDTRIDTYPRGMPRYDRESQDDSAENCDPPTDANLPPSNTNAAIVSSDPPFAHVTDSGDESSEADDSGPIAIAERLRRSGGMRLGSEDGDDFDWDELQVYRDDARIQRGSGRGKSSSNQSKSLERH